MYVQAVIIALFDGSQFERVPSHMYVHAPLGADVHFHAIWNAKEQWRRPGSQQDSVLQRRSQDDGVAAGKTSNDACR